MPPDTEKINWQIAKHYCTVLEEHFVLTYPYGYCNKHGAPRHTDYTFAYVNHYDSSRDCDVRTIVTFNWDRVVIGSSEPKLDEFIFYADPDFEAKLILAVRSDLDAS